MVNHAMRPGMLKRLATEVLPMPYHPTSHCTFPSWDCLSARCSKVVRSKVGEKKARMSAACQTKRAWEHTTGMAMDHTHVNVSQFSLEGGYQAGKSPMAIQHQERPGVSHEWHKRDGEDAEELAYPELGSCTGNKTALKRRNGWYAETTREEGQV